MKYIRRFRTDTPPGSHTASVAKIYVWKPYESEKPVIYRARAFYVNELPIARRGEVTKHSACSCGLREEATSDEKLE